VKLDNLYIQALGSYLPEQRLTLQQATEEGYDSDDLASEVLESLDDYETIAVGGDLAPADMAVAAARAALAAADSKIAMLIHAQMFRQGPETWSPVGYLLRELGIDGATGFEVEQGANGVLAAVQLAAGWLAMAPDTSAALVTTALNAGSAYLDRFRSAGTKTIYGDGAAAAVLGRGSGIARVDSINSLMIPGLEGLCRGSAPLFDEGRVRQMVNLGERGREFVHEKGMEVMDLIKGATRIKVESAHQALSEAGVEPKDLAAVVHTHANPAVIDMSVMHPLGLDLARSSWSFGKTIGHVGAADHLLGLEHFITSGTVTEGDHVLLIGRANGCNFSSAVVTITTGTAIMP